MTWGAIGGGGGGTSSATYTVTDALILGAATTSGIRLDITSGALTVAEGDDSTVAPLYARDVYAAFDMKVNTNATGATPTFWASGYGVSIRSGLGYFWANSSSDATQPSDTGLTRASAGVVKVTDGSTGMGSLRALRTATARTGDATLADTDSLSFQTNEGAAGAVNLTLPTAVAGYSMGLIVQANQYIRFTAATGDTIRDGSTVSAAAGYIRSTTVGSTLIIQSINATEWVVVSKTGTWTVDS